MQSSKTFEKKYTKADKEEMESIIHSRRKRLNAKKEGSTVLDVNKIR